MSAAENDLCTLEAVRVWLGFKDSNVALDKALQRSITACSTAMQRFMDRTIAATNYKHRQNGTGSGFMVLRNAPIIRISSISMGGVAVPASNIEFDEGTVYLSGAHSFVRGRNNIELKYTAGFETIPVDLEQSCIDTVSLRWRERDRIGLSSKGLSGETTSYSLADFPAHVISTMRDYQRMVAV